MLSGDYEPTAEDHAAAERLVVQLRVNEYAWYIVEDQIEEETQIVEEEEDAHSEVIDQNPIDIEMLLNQ